MGAPKEEAILEPLLGADRPDETQVLAQIDRELVAVVPYIYKNEERGTPDLAPRPMVTQTYRAYFFQRSKPLR